MRCCRNTGFALTVLTVLSLTNGCGEVEWLDTPPQELVGAWTEVSDDITIGHWSPQSFVVRSDILVVVVRDFEGQLRRSVYPIRKFSRRNDSFVVFCGEPHENQISEHRYLFNLDRSGWFAQVDEIVATGIDNQDGLFHMGRFTNAAQTR